MAKLAVPCRPNVSRSTIRSIALNLTALLFGFLLIELVLQLGSLVFTPERRGVSARLGSGIRVAALGDSNTFGLYLEPNEAWPAQLQSRWSTATGDPTEVVNLGFPGTSSSQLRRDMARVLDTVHPHLVLVMVGVNDFWTAPVDLDADPRGPVRRFAERHVRLYRLLWAMRRAWQEPDVAVVGASRESPPADLVVPDQSEGAIEYGGQVFDRGFIRASEPPAKIRRNLVANLVAIAAEARGAGAEVIFLTYPSATGFYGRANHEIRQAAQRAEVLLVDLAHGFKAHCPQEPCAEWLFADQHPTARGADWIAQTLAQEISRQSR